MTQGSSHQQRALGIVSAISAGLGAAGKFFAGFFTDVELARALERADGLQERADGLQQDLAAVRGDLAAVKEVVASGTDGTAAELRELLNVDPQESDLNPDPLVVESDG